jgi:DNA-binding transcriptional MerR regulator
VPERIADRAGTSTIAEAAVKVGLSAYTLRWYEQQGLIDPVGRDSAGRRRYTAADVDWLLLLTRLRRTGMPVRDMRRYADLARADRDTTTARRELLQSHRERVRARVAELEEDLRILDHKIDTYVRKET